MKRALLLATCAVIAHPSFAQTAPNPPQREAPSTGGAIEDIIVTARQRSESVQDVPLAVTAVSGDFLERASVDAVESLEKFMPNVELGRHPFAGGGMTASIRGVSYGDLDRAFEPAVAVSVDGIFLASNTGAMIDSFDIASIEVLRGPQGTLFGRNTIGGVINIKRTQPTMNWGLKAEAGIGTFNARSMKVVANAPIVADRLGLKLGGYVERSDSFTRRVSDGKHEDGIDRVSLFGALRFDTGGNFEATLSVDYLDDDSRYPSIVPLSAGPGLPAGQNQTFCTLYGACYGTQYQQILNGGFRPALGDYGFGAGLNSKGAALNMKLDVGPVSIESITGYSKQTDYLDADTQGASFVLPGTPILRSRRDQIANQFSQELRAITDTTGVLNVVAGLYYMRSEFNLLQQAVAVNGTTNSRFNAGQVLNSYAAYAEGYAKISDALRLTIGGRYTSETRDFYINFLNPTTQVRIGGCPNPIVTATQPSSPGCDDPHVTFNKFTPRGSLDYHFTSDVMVYGGWSRGYRSGGWNSRAATQNTIGPYTPETVDSYELGLRSKFLDRRAIANLTVFRAKYRNKQEDVLSASPVNPLVTQTVVQNAAAASIKGFEGEFELVPANVLRLRAAVGYLDAKYDSYLSVVNIAAAGQPVNNQLVDIRDLRNLRYAPKWSLSFGGALTFPAKSGRDEIKLDANVKYTSRFATSVTKDLLGLNRDFIDAYTTVDASASYDFGVGARSHAKISAFVQNALHDDGRLYRKIISTAFSFGSREPGRTAGMRIGFTY